MCIYHEDWDIENMQNYSKRNLIILSYIKFTVIKLTVIKDRYQ